MEYLFFVFFKFAILLSAICVILARNPIYSVLFLVLVFCNSAGLLILLGAEFLAFVFVVVYVGAIAVLFLFVVMMINFKMIELNRSMLSYFHLSAYLIIIVSLELSLILFNDYIPDISYSAITYTNWVDVFFSVSNIKALGTLLYTHYVLLFILSGFILLVAMLGSIVLTLLHRTNMKRQEIYVQVSRGILVRKFN
jgi:NADH-quinone oxidoreductase subunit J